MKCPVCHIDLRMMDREGIEIDYCLQCRGVWLDRGELDKLIERSDTAFRDHRPTRDEHHSQHDDRRRDFGHSDDYRTRDDHHPHDQPRKRKKESFLGDLFEFGD